MKKIGYIIKMVTIILVFSVDNFITSHLILRYYYYKILNFLQKFCNLIYPYFAFNFTFLVFVVKLAPVFFFTFSPAFKDFYLRGFFFLSLFPVFFMTQTGHQLSLAGVAIESHLYRVL